jgi:uncharacterized protein YkwD
MLKSINIAREEAGLEALAFSDSLAQVARGHAEDMIANNFFGHVSPTTRTLASRLRAAGISFEKSGENLAGDSSVSNAFKLWMGSSSHKGNVLGDFNEVGIAVVKGGPYGYMIVAVFAR